MNNSIEIIITLYQCSLENSITFQSLQKQLTKLSIDYELIIFNNDQNQKIEDNRFIVVNSAKNQKLAGAYNFALNKAIEGRKNWILLLDQDTLIPDDYFDELQKVLSGNYRVDLVAIIPTLELKGKKMSPKIISPFMRFEREINETGYTKKRINALNSMSLLNVDFVHAIGGFSTEYPFDFLDQWYYNQIFKLRKLIYILPVTTVHESSFLQLEQNVSLSRYKEFLQVESRFIRCELGWSKYVFYRMKLILRAFKQFIKFKNKKYAFATLFPLD